MEISVFDIFNSPFCSVKHVFEGQWSGNTTRLTTCDPHAKQTVVNSNNPQEIEADKDIIFTYDVEFKVRLRSPGIFFVT